MSNIYHKNGKVSWNGSTAYHENGKVAWNGSTAYHENGKVAWNGSTAYHENGKVAWNGSTAYHENGKVAWNGSTAYYGNGNFAGGNGIEFEIGKGIKIVVGRNGFRLLIFGICHVDESEKNETNNNTQNQDDNSSYDDNSSAHNTKPKVTYSECDTCGQSFRNGDGYQAYIRNEASNKRSDYAKYYFCSESCYYTKFENGHFSPVGEDGLTDNEREEQEKENRKYQIEREKREQIEREKEREIQRKKQLEIDRKNVELKILKAENERKELRLAKIIGIPLLILAIVFFVYKSYDMEDQKKEALRIHSELELFEDSLNLCLQNKQFDKALAYANKLQHPIHEDMENMEFDAWNGYPKFDEYWNKKREEYKNLIFSERATETVPKPNKSSKKNKSVKEKSKSKKNKIKADKNSEVIIDEVPVYDEELDPEYR